MNGLEITCRGGFQTRPYGLNSLASHPSFLKADVALLSDIWWRRGRPMCLP